MKTRRTIALVALIVALFTMVLPLDTIAQRRGGGSFGGSRGGSRGYSSPCSGGGSFGGSRRSSPGGYGGAPRSGSSSTRYGNAPAMRNSFGGSRMSSSSDYTSRYGAPRASTRQTVPSSNGSTNYTVNRYGGMGDGFMMGYMMGTMPWYWSTPFHPAYYYSRPYTAMNPDGTTAIYPGTFQWGTLFFTLLLIGGVIFIVYVWLRNRRRRSLGYVSSGGFSDTNDSGAKSSFM
ncbi:MAG: hypothetical protein NTX15_11905 [Candidatus Kapabacteria bacterium]|nr:hypothetical protein [Candidatus Kapabacteria bacterium]